MWKQINELTGNEIKNIDETILKHFSESNLAEVCNNFNANFVNQSSKLKSRYNRQPKKFETRTEKRKETMYLSEAYPDEIRKIIKEMNIKKSVGTDGIKMEHLQTENSVNFLCPLINAIIKMETWPDKLKTQILRPIYKKGDTKIFDNYRPIALQPAINKLIEKFFACRIQNFLTKYNIITENQYGFQKKKVLLKLLRLLMTKLLKH